jgi:hypothetical protein
VGKPIDTLRQQRGAVEISYNVLGREPFNFFRKIRVNGKAERPVCSLAHGTAKSHNDKRTSSAIIFELSYWTM